jgi:hypothetical protein
MLIMASNRRERPCGSRTGVPEGLRDSSAIERHQTVLIHQILGKHTFLEYLVPLFNALLWSFATTSGVCRRERRLQGARVLCMHTDAAEIALKFCLQ